MPFLFSNSIVVALPLLLIILWLRSSRQRPVAGIPIVHLDKRGVAALLPTKFAFMRHPGELLAKGNKQYPNRCFQISAASGYKVIVPNRFANELRNNPDLDFNQATAQDFFAHYAGFEGVGNFVGTDNNIVLDTVRQVRPSSSRPSLSHLDRPLHVLSIV